MSALGPVSKRYDFWICQTIQILTTIPDQNPRRAQAEPNGRSYDPDSGRLRPPRLRNLLLRHERQGIHRRRLHLSQKILANLRPPCGSHNRTSIDRNHHCKNHCHHDGRRKQLLSSKVATPFKPRISRLLRGLRRRESLRDKLGGRHTEGEVAYAKDLGCRDHHRQIGHCCPGSPENYRTEHLPEEVGAERILRVVRIDGRSCALCGVGPFRYVFVEANDVDPVVLSRDSDYSDHSPASDAHVLLWLRILVR
jgi:hypothetical protein